MLIQIFWILFLLWHDVHSQQYTPVRPQYASCQSKSQCIPIKWCLALRGIPNWETAGLTCGPGVFALRQVCCLGPTVRPVTKRCGSSFIRNPRLPADRNGTAQEGAWPWMVLIVWKHYFSTQCTGILIDQKHVLSAPRCFPNNSISDFNVRVGNRNYKDGVAYEITKLRVHPLYKYAGGDNDVAIIRLAENVDLSTSIPICLPNEEIIRKDLSRTEAVEVGWSSVSPKTNTFLFQSDHIIKSSSECDAAYKDRKVTGNMLCSSFEDESKNPGFTAGSPLLMQNGIRWFLVGIGTFGQGSSSDTSNPPHGFTRISSYVVWIKSVTNE